MVKGWADHCSSDEEDHDVHEKVDLHADDDDDMKEGHHLTTEETPPKEAPPQAPKTYDYPNEPPYTAYVGNLSYNVTDPKELAAEITELAKDKLGVDIKIEDSRIMMDRRSEKPRHRGFGYVQVETLDMLKALMQLNDGNTMLSGRRLQLDTANGGRQDRHQRKTSGSDIDGSKFRGGRYADKRRGSNRRSNGEQQQSSDSPAQRPSLKLQPRTKPVEEGGADNKGGGSSSNIFGGAKPRDEQTWQERRKSEQDTRRHSKGGRGDRRGGRGGTGRSKDGAGKTGKDEKRKSETKPVEKKAPAPPAAAQQQQPQKPAEKKITNKFAALDFDSDSD